LPVGRYLHWCESLPILAATSTIAIATATLTAATLAAATLAIATAALATALALATSLLSVPLPGAGQSERGMVGVGNRHKRGNATRRNVVLWLTRDLVVWPQCAAGALPCVQPVLQTTALTAASLATTTLTFTAVLATALAAAFTTITSATATATAIATIPILVANRRKRVVSHGRI
jgi:hypothetical protein